MAAGLHLLVQRRPEGSQEQVGIASRAVYVTHIFLSATCNIFINLLAHSVILCLRAVSILFDRRSSFESDFIATKCLCSSYFIVADMHWTKNAS